MSALLEIFGKGVDTETSSLLMEWLQRAVAEGQQRNTVSPYAVDIVEHINAQRLETAEEHLRLWLFDEPDSVLGRMAGACLALTRHQLAQAVEDLMVVYGQQPSNTTALYALGNCHELLGDEENAIAFYQDCLKFQHHLQYPAQRLAAIYLKNRCFGKAIEQYQLLKKLYPEDLSPLLILGHLFIATGRNAEAIDTFSRTILLHPDSLSYEDHDLNALLQNSDYQEALAHVDGMIDLYPGRPDLLVKRGDVLQLLGAIEEAFTEYRQALDICPEYMDAAIKLASLHVRNGGFQEAAKLFSHAMEVHDQIIDAYLGLALAHHRSQEVQEATAALCSAAMIQPNSTLLFMEVSRSLLTALSNPEGYMIEEPDPNEATLAVIHAHQAQLVQQSHNLSVQYRLGLLNLYLGGPEPAVPHFEQAAQKHGLFPRATAKLALCHYAMGQPEQALAELDQFNVTDAETLYLHYETAKLYWTRVKFAATVLNLSHTLEGHLAEADPAFPLAIVLQNLGILDRSEQRLENLEETLCGVMAGPNNESGDLF